MKKNTNNSARYSTNYQLIKIFQNTVSYVRNNYFNNLKRMAKIK